MASTCRPTTSAAPPWPSPATPGRTTFSAPTERQPDGVIAVFVVQALYRPGASLETTAEREANVVGYITASVPGDVLVARMLEEAGPGCACR